MAFNFPVGIQYAQQMNYLQRAWQDQLRENVGYLDMAFNMDFPNKIGQTFTFTRPQRFAYNTTPLNPANVASNLNNGMTVQNFNIEQYTMQLLTYGGLATVDIVAEQVLLASEYIVNAKNLALQGRQSVDILARNATIEAYIGGNTYVITTLGTAGPTIHVDDITGFQTLYVNGQPTPIGVSNTLLVYVNGNPYTLIGNTPDGTNISQNAPLGGISGTLTFSTNVSTADGTQWNSVIAYNAAPVVRPSNRVSTAALQPGDTVV
jgi:hypothetical protein